MIKNILKAIPVVGLALSLHACYGLDGDNSDFNFEGTAQKENPARLENSVRLATYNLHGCAPSGSSIADYTKVGKVISYLDVDIIALQEVYKNTVTHPEDQVQELAERTGLKPYFCKAITTDGGQYGNAVLAKEAPIKTASLALPGTQARVLFVLEFDDYVFMATHLCHKSQENREYAFDKINQYVADNYATYDKPIFLAGDMNMKTLPTNASDNWTTISTTAPTFPNGNTRIDYVLVYKGNSPVYEVKRTFIPNYDDIDLKTVSDHLPVLVDLNEF